MPTSTVNKAPLTTTPPAADKTYCSALADLTGGGLTSVNIIYGNGSAVRAAVGTYTCSVAALIVADGNGFLIGNFDVTYKIADIIVAPFVHTITVKA
ncbi:hypothetical protein IDJ77_26690 [Mucilaginibacter sp. ZT4R22]|uniref:Uncharacterized protein n=1 Tax=Mucilaginibacter pankratovii TaxID=2772110 RepID=A0ABR7X1L7_9SPHI|nr:hypothetical protein [Mucilaginibacter pankratovii]MBD1367427.1 hypothetical protein [Mucilaginibacter pankratovii]